MPVTDVGDVEALEVEQLGEEHGVLVGGPAGHGREPPVMGQPARRRGVALGPDATPMLSSMTGSVSGRRRVEADHRLGVARRRWPAARQTPSAGSRAASASSRRGRARDRARGPSGSGRRPRCGRRRRPRRRRSVASVTPPDTSIRIGPGGGDAGHRDRLDHVAGVHVVEQHGVAPAAAASAPGRAVALHLDHADPATGVGPGDRVGDLGPGQVVVLDQDRVGEAAPVVGPATGPDGGLLEERAGRASSCGCRGPRSPGWPLDGRARGG